MTQLREHRPARPLYEQPVPSEIPGPPEWSVRALCRGLASPRLDPWHPADHGNDRSFPFAVGRQVCAQCPVRLECVRHGLSLLADTRVQGMFGGLTPRELYWLARRLGLPARYSAGHGTRARYVGSRNTPPCRCPACRRANTEAELARRKAAAAETECHRCGQLFTPRSPGARYCSRACSGAAQASQRLFKRSRTAPEPAVTSRSV